MAISRKLLIFTNIVAFVISLAMLVGVLVFLYGGIEVAQLEGVPTEAYYILIAFNLAVFLISVLGLVGTTTHSKVATIVFIVLNMISALILVVGMVFGLLYANGQSTVGELDDFAKEAQAQLEKSLVDRAIEDPELWAFTTSSIECCGVDLEAVYSYADYDYNLTDFIAALHVGENCAASSLDTIETIVLNNTYSADVEADALDILGDDFFCKNKISVQVVTNTMFIAIGAGVLVLVQIITIVAAFVLLLKVPISEGGFAKEKEYQQNGGQLTGTGGPQTSYQANQYN